ncbi:hypothetical protein [Desulfovibrio inopinatus]|nr:hypothetical protein [Desulfovibrio inopinatus]
MKTVATASMVTTQAVINRNIERAGEVEGSKGDVRKRLGVIEFIIDL